MGLNIYIVFFFMMIVVFGLGVKMVLYEFMIILFSLGYLLSFIGFSENMDFKFELILI